MEIYQNLSLENLPDEEWRDVVGYEGLYQVSNLGRVKSLEINLKDYSYSKRTEKIMSQHDNGKGYLTVSISINGKTKKMYTHRLVATSFIYKDGNKTEVNHKNLNKKDNNISNLEWVSKKENMHHARINGAFKDTKIYQYSIEGFYEREFSSLTKAAIFHNLSSKGDICRACKNERAICKGHRFRYYKKDKIDIPKKKFKEVEAYKGDILVTTYLSAKEASISLGVKENTIVTSCLRNIKCKGYTLKYTNNGRKKRISNIS